MALARMSIGAAQWDTALDSSRQASVLLINTNRAAAPVMTPAKPAIAVSHQILDFGAIPIGNLKKLTFTVQNVGAGSVSGAASVPAPFRALAGSPYNLKYPQTQTITVQYRPESIGMHMAVVHLTGGDGTDLTVTVMGSAVPRKLPPRRRVPAAVQNVRLLASRS
jgi:hypothetical protein